MSKWTHSICGSCWLEREGERPAVRAQNADDVCCFCGTKTALGIYIRQDPATVKCQGQGGTHEGEGE